MSQPQGRLAGSVALVTGGARNVGLGIAQRFVAEGARVVVVARSADQGKESLEQLQAAGGVASFVQTDVSDPAQVSRAVEHAVSTYGGLHILVNNLL